MPEPHRKGERAEQEAWLKLKCKWTLGTPGKGCHKGNTKGCQGKAQVLRSWAVKRELLRCSKK